MPLTPPDPADIAALDAASTHLRETADYLIDQAGILTLVSERLQVVQPEPPPCPEVPLSLPRVGIGGSGAFGGLTRANRQKMLALAKACGIKEFRFDCQWQGVEPRRNEYFTKNVVEKAQDVIATGLTPMILIGWAPKFYRADPNADMNGAPAASSLEAWRRFLQRLFADLYAVGVRRFEVWNEPNFLFMQPVSPELWADLVLIASEVASDLSRHIVIIAGGVCPAVDTPPRSVSAAKFYDRVVAHEPRFFEYVDEVGIHPYAGNHTKLKDGKFWREQVSHIRTLKPVEVPFCGTEHGWKSGQNTEAERTQFYTDTVLNWDEQAPVYLFSLFDFAEKYGLVLADGTPKPVYLALQKLLVR